MTHTKTPAANGSTQPQGTPPVALRRALRRLHDARRDAELAADIADATGRPRDRVLAGISDARAAEAERVAVMTWYAVAGLVDDGDWWRAWDDELAAPSPFRYGGLRYTLSFETTGPDGDPRLVVEPAG